MMTSELAATAASVRGHIVQMARSPEGCHLGGSMSAVEILVALYFAVLRVDPAAPRRIGRDTFILSKGHAAAALYAVLAERGFLDPAELTTYGLAGGRLAGHPLRRVPGVEFATGSLGHGLALGAGTALSDRLRGRLARTYVLLGDGELQEGSVWEAALVAARLRLDNLVGIVDANGLQINGRTRDTAETLARRWDAFGWATAIVDGHDLAQLVDRLSAVPFASERPAALVAVTIKGKGVARLENRVKSHYVTLAPTMDVPVATAS